MHRNWHQASSRSMAMGGTRKTLLAVGSLALLFIFSVLSRGHAVGKTTEEENADRYAIRMVLNAPQTAWNRGDVDASVARYWRSPYPAFCGSTRVPLGLVGVRASA